MKTVEYWLARFVLATLSFTSLSTANALARFYLRLLDLALPRRLARRFGQDAAECLERLLAE